MTIEYREAVGGVQGHGDTLVGLVTPFNTWTTIGDKRSNGFDEQVAPTAFTKTLQERDVVLVHNHNTAMPMARTSITEGPGSLTLKPAGDGLRAEAKPVQTSYGKDVLQLADAGVIRGMSFGFEVLKDSWTDDAGNPATSATGTKRTIHEVRLHEVTTTAFPAYPTTELSARDSVNAARGVMESRDDNPKPYGDVKYADPKNGKYPIDTEAHARAAWAYINMPKNAEQYPMNGVQLSDVKDAIIAACKHFGIDVDEAKRVAAWLNTEARAKAVDDDGDASHQGTAEDTQINESNKCSMCGQNIPGATPEHPAANGSDGDSDADDQQIDRNSEPAETTRDEMTDAEYAAWLAQAMEAYKQTL